MNEKSHTPSKINLLKTFCEFMLNSHTFLYLLKTQMTLVKVPIKENLKTNETKNRQGKDSVNA